jgi:very-short-patch-repair endonuclease
LQEARAAGLTKRSLQGKTWRRLGTELYCWSGLPEDPWGILSAWQALLPSNAVFAGETAAWISGLDFKPIHPVEVVVPPHSSLRSRHELSVRRCKVPLSDMVTIRGLRTTKLNRSICDLSRRLPAVEVLIALDMALHKGLSLDGDWRKMETRLRWLLIQRGLPHPEVQVNLGNAKNPIGRADLYYPSARLILEYDGTNHRDRLVEDNRRQNQLLSAGYQLLRFTAGDIYNQPDVVAALVRGALTQSAARRSTSATMPSRIFRPASQKPGSVMSMPRRRTSSSGRVEPPAARNSR